jgi:hypothetical protein
LNFAFFRFPWPWETWTARTPNSLFYTVCVLGLTVACLTLGQGRERSRQAATPG